MILTITPNPCVDKTVFIRRLVPGTFVRAQRYSCVAGGKGCNVSKAVKTMGGNTKALVVVGGHTGRHVVEMLEQDEGVPCVPVWVKSPTRTITTVLEEPEHRQTAFFEPGPAVSDAEAASLVETFRSSLIGVQAVAFCGTVSDPALSALYETLIPMAKDAGALTILDSHGPEFAAGIKALPHMIKPNLLEAGELLGLDLRTERARLDAVEALHDRGIEMVVLSLGKDGALVSFGGERFRVVPPEIEEVNAVGSGDAMTAGFAMGLIAGDGLQDMARRACAMGAANATTWDIGHFTRDAVDALAQRVEIQDA